MVGPSPSPRCAGCTRRAPRRGTRTPPRSARRGCRPPRADPAPRRGSVVRPSPPPHAGPAAHRSCACPGAGSPRQPFLAHQPRHALHAHRVPPSYQVGMDPRRSIGPSRMPMNRPHLAPQLLIAPRMARTPAASPRLSHPLGETPSTRHIVATRWTARFALTSSKTSRAPSRSPERTKPRLFSGYPVLREAGDSPDAAAATPRARHSSDHPRDDLHRGRPDAPNCGSPATNIRTVYLRQTTKPLFASQLPRRATGPHQLHHLATVLRRVRRMSFCHPDTSSAQWSGVHQIGATPGWGLASSLYTDRGSHYWYTPEAGGKSLPPRKRGWTECVCRSSGVRCVSSGWRCSRPVRRRRGGGVSGCSRPTRSGYPRSLRRGASTRWTVRTGIWPSATGRRSTRSSRSRLQSPARPSCPSSVRGWPMSCASTTSARSVGTTV